MEKDVIETYLRIDKKEFDSVKNKANEKAIEEDPNNEDVKNELMFSDATINIDEMYIEDDKDILHVAGELHCFGKELGWINLEIPLNKEIAKGIIDRYMDKLNKLKSILEATE